MELNPLILQKNRRQRTSHARIYWPERAAMCSTPPCPSPLGQERKLDHISRIWLRRLRQPCLIPPPFTFGSAALQSRTISLSEGCQSVGQPHAVATAAFIVIEDKIWNRLRWNIRFSSGK
jgi:hypothetical protein